MNSTRKRSIIANLAVWAIGSILLVLLDQYTKYLAVLHLKGQDPLVLWQGVLNSFTRKTGALPLAYYRDARHSFS